MRPGLASCWYAPITLARSRPTNRPTDRRTDPNRSERRCSPPTTPRDRERCDKSEKRYEIAASSGGGGVVGSTDLDWMVGVFRVGATESTAWENAERKGRRKIIPMGWFLCGWISTVVIVALVDGRQAAAMPSSLLTSAVGREKHHLRAHLCDEWWEVSVVLVCLFLFSLWFVVDIVCIWVVNLSDG